MKKIILFISIVALGFAGCKKSSLQILNPNSPTPNSSLTTEAGARSFALGLYQKWVADVPGEGGTNIFDITLANHSIMGDEEWVSAGNWGLRWTDQVYSVTLPTANGGKTIVNPNGTTQQQQLKSTNSRTAGERNSFIYEWQIGYYLIGQSNLLLQAANGSTLSVSATEKAVLQAWGYWWKGLAYSRIGSMYLSGVINNATDGTTNSNFVSHDAIITEANNNFNKAISILSGVTDNADYDATMDAIIPSFNKGSTRITPQVWIKEMYTYEARNYLANHKVAAMTATDWTQITALASKGLQQGDVSFLFGMDPTGTNDLSSNFFHPIAFHSSNNSGWSWVSERLIQDFKTGDTRFTKGFRLLSAPQVNRSSRGLQFGTRYQAIEIENGGLYATNNNLGAIQFAGSWEENTLMLAEAQIRTGNINAGLAYVDLVRDAQNAGLAHVANTGLNQVAATEELRRERRIGLYLRGLAFYDARRWGITAPVSSGGGRAGAIVLVPGTLLGTTTYQALPCIMDYNYMDYWDVPANELDFNNPSSGSAPVAN